MKTKKVAATIYQSTSFHLFELDVTNRALRSLSKLRLSMKKYGFLDAYPIHVIKRGAKFVIIDGQHRFSVARELEIPVKYVVCEDSDILISEINDTQTKWTIADHVESLATKGNPQYQYLLNFSRSHKLPVGISAALLAQTNVKRGLGSKVRGGGFAVSDSEHAEKVASVITEAAKVGRFAKNSLFVDAVRRCIGVKGFDIVRFVKKMHAHPYLMVAHANLDGYIGMIEAIYNYHASAKMPVAFLAKNPQ